jgi:virginiamycin B lyase
MRRFLSIASFISVAFAAGCSGHSTLPTAIPSVASRSHIVPDKRGMVSIFLDTFGDATPSGIVAGPDGALWFTDPGNDVIGRVTTDGTYTLEQTTGTEIDPGITVGPGKDLWFTQESQEGGIGSITTSGKVTLYKDPGGAYTQFITTAVDGTLWFTEINGTVGHRSKNGMIKHFHVAAQNAELEGIVQGPDKNFWITEGALGSHFATHVYRLTKTGQVKQFTFGAGPESICVGSDGALWFSEQSAGSIGRLTTSGKLTQYTLPSPHTDPYGIAAGPDGAIWFTDSSDTGDIGRITTSGKLSFYAVGSNFTGLASITAGPDGAMWFASGESPSAIGRITVH